MCRSLQISLSLDAFDRNLCALRAFVQQMSAADDNLARVSLKPRYCQRQSRHVSLIGCLRRSDDDQPATLCGLIALGAFRQPNRDELSLHVHSSSLSPVDSGVHSASVTFSVQRYGAVHIQHQEAGIVPAIGRPAASLARRTPSATRTRVAACHLSKSSQHRTERDWPHVQVSVR